MNRRRFLIFLGLAYLLLGIGFSLVVPLGEAPDELDHLRYVQYLVARRQFPVMAPQAADNATMEANQPPLYYLLAALAWGPGFSEPFSNGPFSNGPFPDGPFSGAAADRPDAGLVDLEQRACFTTDPYDPGRNLFYRHTSAESLPYRGHYAAFWRVRLFSLLLGLGTVLLTYYLGRQLAPGHEGAARLAAALVAFNPQFLFISASANNDNLMALLGAATLLLSLAVYRRRTTGRLLALGCLLGLGALTKLGLFALWPAAGLALLLAPRPAATRPARLRGVIGDGLWLGLPALLLAGWWYWRAQRLYGDPLVWTVHLQAKGSQVLRTAPFAAADLREFVSLHFQTYWARFGWFSVAPPPLVYWLLAGLVGLALLGLALLLVDWRRKTAPMVAPNGAALLLSGLVVAGVYLSLFRYIQTINWSGYQGRLAFAAIAPVAALLALGLWRLGGRALAWLAGGGLAALALASLLLWLPAAFPRATLFEPAGDLTPVCARLTAWELEGVILPERVRPGADLTIELHGYALADMIGRPLWLDLVGADGVVVGTATVAFSADAGEITTTTVTIPVDAAAQPARGRLRLSGTPGEPITNAAGQPRETPFSLGFVKIEPAPVELPAPQHPAAARFGGALRLYGYDAAAMAGATEIRLYWQADMAMDQDYTFFIHVLDAQGGILAQWDGQPAGGAYPTSIWDEGERVVLPAVLTLPPAYDAVVAGVYYAPSGVRLTLAEGGDTVQLQVDVANE